MRNVVLGWSVKDYCGIDPEFPAPVVGDTLRVREDLHRGLIGVVGDMLQYAGQFVTVTKVSILINGGVSSVHIDADDGEWNWFYYCFEAPNQIDESLECSEEEFLRFISGG